MRTYTNKTFKGRTQNAIDEVTCDFCGNKIETSQIVHVFSYDLYAIKVNPQDYLDQFLEGYNQSACLDICQNCFDKKSATLSQLIDGVKR